MTQSLHRFSSSGVSCAATLHRPSPSTFTTDAGAPCVVMGHGFGGLQTSGLHEFAAAFADHGFAALSFDYRHFGESEGAPRNVVSVRKQLDDYRSAVAYARTLGGVDPRRIVVWGTSLAGGHAMSIGAEDHRVAAVIALTPAADGAAAMVDVLRANGPRPASKLMRTAVEDVVVGRRGTKARYVSIVGRPGTAAALTAPGALEGYEAIAGPGWRNQVAARALLTVGLYRPVRAASRITAPTLVQVADLDRTAPPSASARAGERARATVHHYPCDHFDVYPGQSAYETVLEHQLTFLSRTFRDKATPVAVPA